MEILVLGPGCAKCEKLYDEVTKAVAAAGVEVDLQKIVKLDEIISFGVMMTPALVVNGEVKCSGKVPKASEIAGWITAAGARPSSAEE